MPITAATIIPQYAQIYWQGIPCEFHGFVTGTDCVAVRMLPTSPRRKIRLAPFAECDMTDAAVSAQ